jgi:uncharacterized protein HemX
MVKKTVQKGSGSRAGLGLAALAAAGAAAAAGYYFYASENAPKNRKIAAKWAGDMKRDVVKEAKKLRKIDKAAVMKIVNQAQQAYAKNGPKIDKAALLKAASELKKHWDEIRDEAIPVAKKAVKKSVKKAAQKSK